MWIELKDILGWGGLPTTVQGLVKKAKVEHWERRRKEGVKGKVYEYSFTSLPEEVQAEYVLKHQAPAPAPTGAPKSPRSDLGAVFQGDGKTTGIGEREINRLA